MADRRETIIAPEYVENISKPVIFLAGPIQGADDWQTEAMNYIKSKNPNIIIASPRRDKFSRDFKYDEQVDWETHYLNEAAKKGGIIFWLAKEKEHIEGRDYAQTSRFELGEWKAKHEIYGVKLVIGIEPGFSGERYIRKRLSQDCPEIEIQDTLEATCQKALKECV